MFESNEFGREGRGSKRGRDGREDETEEKGGGQTNSESDQIRRETQKRGVKKRNAY